MSKSCISFSAILLPTHCRAPNPNARERNPPTPPPFWPSSLLLAQRPGSKRCGSLNTSELLPRGTPVYWPPAAASEPRACEDDSRWYPFWILASAARRQDRMSRRKRSGLGSMVRLRFPSSPLPSLSTLACNIWQKSFATTSSKGRNRFTEALIITSLLSSRRPSERNSSAMSSGNMMFTLLWVPTCSLHTDTHRKE
ncbi:hypothetical protein EYF80_008646 [Liparis tanakae]|uniref:Uncharacterized protein n=1 Tax=Liparis tanakae TaxID=230148 RepID=A0A4Z2ISL8_9TELE|nr:hypothetical protein EYF80_008646 [Liparis tanakae]